MDIVRELRARASQGRFNIEAAETIEQLRAEIESLRADAEIAKLSIAYREAQKITQSRANSEQFWDNADEMDMEEMDLEESLAQMSLFSAIDEALRQRVKEQDDTIAALQEELDIRGAYETMKAQLADQAEQIKVARDWIVANSFHDDTCNILYLTEDGVHGECSCGLIATLAKLEES